MLAGSQVPTHRYVPRARSSAGPEAVDLAASAGLLLDPAQKLVLEGALGERPDGRWAATTVTVVECRQNGKGAIAEARELAGLYLFGEQLLTHTAHRYDTSQEHFRRMKPLAVRVSDSTGDRRLKIKRISETNGDESIELMSGQRLVFKARTKLSGRGFSGDLVMLDEAMYLQELGSLIPTMSARRNPQLWFMGSAPLPRIESDTLRRLVLSGRRASGSRKHALRRAAYFEWCAQVAADPGDPDAWWTAVDELLADPDAHNQALALANPALGRRLDREWIETTERPTMTDEEYARERLGLFPLVTETKESAIDERDWSACASPASKPLDPVVFAFEVSLDRRWSCIATAGLSDQGGGTHVEIVDNRRGTSWVVDRLVELRDKWSPTAIACNPAGPAGALLVECIAKGLTVGVPEQKNGKRVVRDLTGREYQQACGSALDNIAARRWRHLGQAVLTTAVIGADKRAVGDAVVFDRKGQTDISPLLAVTVAAWIAGRPAEERKKAKPFVIVT